MKLFALCLSLITVVAAQTATPSNRSIDLPHRLNNGPILLLVDGKSQHPFNLIPLTSKSYTTLKTDKPNKIEGNLHLITPQTGSLKTKNKTISYISCDPSSYNQSEITQADVVQRAASSPQVHSLLFYSETSKYCNISSASDFPSHINLYSVVKSASSSPRGLEKLLIKDGSKPPKSVILTNDAIRRLMNQQPTLGGSGSTAVAMIILYSITGVITALFLIIIITGAIRAHRHPERYGPRNVLGRPRQSRAKGIARAMLDTIPIVKFGESQREENKDLSNVELENGTNQNHAASQSAQTESTQETSQSRDVSETTASGGAPTSDPQTSSSQEQPTSSSNQTPNASDVTPAAQAESSSHEEDEAQGCSICTEDFSIGDDIRVLPCNHKFHPPCVDPWLLDVSGTCPLCRVDLNPSASQDSQGAGENNRREGQGEEGEEGEGLPPPLDPNAGDEGRVGPRRRNTLRGFLGLTSGGGRHQLRNASREERIETLRRWRLEAQSRNPENQNSTNPETRESTRTGDVDESTGNGEDSRRHNRLSGLSRLIRRGRDRREEGEQPQQQHESTS